MSQDVTDYFENGEFVKRIVRSKPEEKIDPVGELIVSPKFDEMVYENKQAEFIKTILERLRKGDNFQLLLVGGAGTGKTYTSKLFSAELNRPYVYLNGQLGSKKITEILLNLKQDSVVCIDEIHRLSDRTAETLYPALEYGEISVDGKAVKITSNPLYIATTTDVSMLPKPLQDRMIRIPFKEPTEQMTYQILIKMGVENEAISSLLKYTLNIRVLKKLIKLMELYGRKDLISLKQVFNNMGINIETGFDELQTQYLDYLKRNGIASLRNLSLILGVSENQIKYDIERDLIKKSLIHIGSKGRELCSIEKNI